MCVLVCCGLHALCCPVDPALDMYSNFHVDVSLLPHRLPAAVQAAAALPLPPLKFRLVADFNHHEPIQYHCLYLFTASLAVAPDSAARLHFTAPRVTACLLGVHATAHPLSALRSHPPVHP